MTLPFVLEEFANALVCGIVLYIISLFIGDVRPFWHWKGLFWGIVAVIIGTTLVMVLEKPVGYSLTPPAPFFSIQWVVAYVIWVTTFFSTYSLLRRISPEKNAKQ